MWLVLSKVTIVLSFLDVSFVTKYMQVSKIIYCDRFCPEKAAFRSTCMEFTHIVDCVLSYVKIRLLHITDDLLMFGPASS